MPIVTSIKPQKNNKRVNIYLDGKFGFGLDLENFVKEKIKVEQELSETQIAAIVKKAEFAKTRDKLLLFATNRPRSEKEITDWFRRKKVHESLHKKLIDLLKKYDFLNDHKFASWWVEQRLRFGKHSKRVITNELKLKGIGQFIIEDTFAKFDVNDAKTARNLVTKNMYKWERFKGPEKNKKMIEFLARKGFGWDIIKKTIRVDD